MQNQSPKKTKRSDNSIESDVSWVWLMRLMRPPYANPNPVDAVGRLFAPERARIVGACVGRVRSSGIGRRVHALDIDVDARDALTHTTNPYPSTHATTHSQAGQMAPPAAKAVAASAGATQQQAPPPPSSTSSKAASMLTSDARRFDRRQCNQLRPPLCELGPLNRADGSARFAMVRMGVLSVCLWGVMGWEGVLIRWRQAFAIDRPTDLPDTHTSLNTQPTHPSHRGRRPCWLRCSGRARRATRARSGSRGRPSRWVGVGRVVRWVGMDQGENKMVD